MKTTRSILIPFAVLAMGAHAQVVINEISASNYNSYADNFGEYEDWVELYNAGASADISGWYLSNDPATPMKWQVPAGTVLAAGAHQVFFCSGTSSSGGGFYHTSFKISQTSADHVVLADAGGVVVDDEQITLRTQAGHSRGRTTDGAATWSLFLSPTPGAANAGAGPDYAPMPALSPAAGEYAAAQNVTISVPAGCVVRYTTNGSVPTAASTQYAGPLNVASTTVVRAAAFSSTPGVPPSFIETNTYFINEPHTVAVVSICGDQLATLMGGTQIEPVGSLEYFGPDGVLRDESTGDFNKHGNDSWAYPQRGIDFISRDQMGYNDGIHYPVFRIHPERHKFQRLILKAAANDNYPAQSGGSAHIRDAFVESFAQVAGLKLDCRSFESCVLYVNGQYWGVYDLREKVDDPDYTKKYYDQDVNNLHFLQTWGGTWSAYGGTAAQTDWNALYAYIMGNNMGDPTAFAYVDGQYNWKSLVDYTVLNSYVVCSDWLNWNTMWWRGLDPNGDHKKWGYCLWDEDATFGHYINYTGVPSQAPDADPCNPEQLGDPGGQGHIPILNKLINENQTVHDYYVNRYIDLTNTVFQCGYMTHYLDSLITIITPEMPGQIARWGGSMGEWQANVQQLRDFMQQRCSDIQQGMVDCYDLTGPYPVVFQVDPPLSGQIKVNSAVLPEYPFQGTYYGDINTGLQAISAAGWTFDHWEALHHTFAPTMQDSLVSFQFTTSDTIIAHFKPPISLPVVLLTDPLNKATITFNGTPYSSFPVTVGVAVEQQVPLSVDPAEFYDFAYWEIRHNPPNTNDSTRRDIRITFYEGDTIVAHLTPQEYGYWAPNAFTPNGDGINDTWQPWGNVIDLKTFELEIYDRWGRLMYASTKPSEGWDGTSSGSEVPIGVYAFRAHIEEGITRKHHDVAGHVTVVR